jgi:ATP-dependent RNA helicase DDX27
VDDLDVLVLDEVDRLLDLGFQEEIEELVRHCPINRQTLLFSATMTPKVEDLAKLSLRKPVRVKTSGGATTLAPRLVQEFVKVRKDDEREKEAMLASLICRNFNKRVIVFYEMKKDAHR